MYEWLMEPVEIPRALFYMLCIIFAWAAVNSLLRRPTPSNKDSR